MICEKCLKEIPAYIDKCPQCINSNEIKFLTQLINSDKLRDNYFLANKLKRFINCLIDQIAILIFFFIICFFLGIFDSIFNLSIDFISSTDKNIIFFNVLYFVTIMFYYFLFELFFYKTVGKMITKTIVVRNDGKVLTAKDVLYRTIARLIPFEAVFVMIRNIGLHDSLSKTIVIYHKEKTKLPTTTDIRSA